MQAVGRHRARGDVDDPRRAVLVKAEDQARRQAARVHHQAPPSAGRGRYQRAQRRRRQIGARQMLGQLRAFPGAVKRRRHMLRLAAATGHEMGAGRCLAADCRCAEFQ